MCDEIMFNVGIGCSEVLVIADMLLMVVVVVGESRAWGCFCRRVEVRYDAKSSSPHLKYMRLNQ